ncbi:hydrolase [Kosmotoga arenicorallina S304]|uniref:Hydrolase n=1 Tax=Kosmotoga arenicorallina S304 TaxID=1453497 RepID=A0A176K1X2_9BACT|nr:YfbR-like 5'-deoxynucleotidase [Kosmotoga arenicorallina]OAA30889.1 hydrolase [Kosmotoga arenicorallina S304]
MYQGLIRLLELYTNLFTMFRWNNRPTLLRTNEAENAFISAQFSLLLSLIAREHGEEINEDRLFKRILFKELPKCIISDISVDTKVLIKELDPEKWDAVFDATVSEVAPLLPENHREDFMNEMKAAKDDSIEGKIISIGDLLSATLEADIHSRFFPEYYEEALGSLKKRLSRFDDFQPYRILKESLWIKDYQEALVVLLRAVRWNRLKRNVETTVAGHSFYVAVIAYLLALMENEVGNNVNSLEVVKKALLHDIPESLTGDIITPTKRKVKGFEEVISRVEEKMVSERLLVHMPESIALELKQRMLDPFGGTEGKLVRAADLTAAVVECLMEIKTGNAQLAFRSAISNMLDTLSESEFENVRYLSDSLRWGLEWVGR